MSNSHSSSHARWQGATRWKQGYNAAWKEWDDSTTTESAAPELISDERVMNALHKMQDNLQQTMVISQSWSQKTYNRSKAHQGRMEMPLMRPRRLLLKHVIVKKKRSFFHEHKNVKRPQKPRRSSTAPSKTLFQKTDALGKHVKTVNMRGGVLGDHGGGLLQDGHSTAKKKNRNT